MPALHSPGAADAGGSICNGVAAKAPVERIDRTHARM